MISGENFPYVNFHDLNMDWIIKIVKEFHDNYSNIESNVENGITAIQNAGTEELGSFQTEAEAIEQSALLTIQNLISTIPDDFEEFLMDFINLRTGLMSGNIRVVWTDNEFYDITTGNPTSSPRYSHTNALPKFLLRFFANWNKDIGTSYVSLFNNGTYVGYMTRTLETNLEYTDFVLNILKTDYEDYKNILSVSNLYSTYNLINAFTSNMNRLYWVDNAFIDLEDGSETSNNRYAHTALFHKSYLKYIFNWNPSLTTSYISLYKNGTYVGYMTGTLDTAIDYDGVALNVLKTDYPDYTRTLEILNYKTIAEKLNNVITIHVSNPAELINAVAEAIENEYKDFTYDIIIAPGTYELWPVLDKSIISGTGDQLYQRGLELPDRCNLYGTGNVTISCTIPESDNSAEHPYTHIVSTLNMHNTRNIIKNIHFVGDNTRYCIHDDSGFDDPYKELLMENCTFTHNGTESPSYMPSPRCYGAGYVTGRKGIFRNCKFAGNGNCNTLFYVHTHSGDNNLSNCYTELHNCAFLSTTDRAIDYQVPSQTDFGGVLTINNCWFNTGCYVETRGESPSTVYGAGNGSNVTFQNNNQSLWYMNN